MPIVSHKERLVSNTIAPCYQTENGYITQTTRKIYIKRAVEAGRWPIKVLTPLGWTMKRRPMRVAFLLLGDEYFSMDPSEL